MLTTDSIRTCSASTRDLIWDMLSELQDSVCALRAARGEQAAEAFLQLVRNMDDAGAFFGGAENEKRVD